MTISLNAEKRETGKPVNNKLRQEKKIPAVIYGKNLKENINIAINENDIINQYNRAEFMHKLSEVKIGSKTHKVIAKAVELHPVTDRIEHIDFLDVSKEKKVIVDVRVKAINTEKSKGIKLGGYINFVKRFVKIECAPLDIPAVIEVDISNVNLGQAVKASDLNLSDKLKNVFKDDQAILTIIGRGGGKADEEDASTAEASAEAPKEESAS